jgi:hypothetical protein
MANADLGSADRQTVEDAQKFSLFQVLNELNVLRNEKLTQAFFVREWQS